MKTLSLFTIIYICFISTVFGQVKPEILTDSSVFLGSVIKNTILKPSPSFLSQSENKEIFEGDNVFIYAVFNSDKSYDSDKYYGVYHDLDSGFVNVNDILIADSRKNYIIENNQNLEGIEVRKKYSKIYALTNISLKLEEIEKKYAKYNKKGLVITKIEYAFSDVGSQFGLTFSFYNGYNKDIKYINFSTRPYNRLGDITRDDIGKDKATGRIIGPLEKKSESTVTFDELYWDDNDIIDCVKVTYLKITFMDGTIKEIVDLKNNLGDGVKNSCK